MSINKQPPRLTPSNINDLDCDKKFHTLHVEKDWKSKSRGQFFGSFGTALHAVLKNVYDPRIGVPPNLTYLDEYIQEALFNGQYDNPQAVANEAARCRTIVCGYVGNEDEEDIFGTIDVERYGTFTIQQLNKPTFVIAAKLDRVLVRPSNPSQLVVRDYKTSRRQGKLNQALIQLWVAKLLYPQYTSHILEIDWIDSEGGITRETVKAAQLQGLLALKLSQAHDKFARTIHVAEPGDSCTYCPLQAECQPHEPITLDSPDSLFQED